MRFALAQSLPDEHAYSIFARTLADCLEALGHSATILAAQEGKSLFDIATQLQADGIETLISFGALIGGVALADGTALLDALGVRFVGWLFDHPIYAQHNLMLPMRHRISIFPSDDHRLFAERIGVSGDSFTMLAGGGGVESSTPWGKRDMPVLVAATWNGVPHPFWENMTVSPVRQLVEQVYERLSGDPGVSLIHAWDSACSDLSLSIPITSDGVAAILRDTLTYVRHRDRIAAVEALVNAGQHVTVIGDGWESYFGPKANVSFFASVPFGVVDQLYGQAKIVINLNSANGGCERAFYAMRAGAAVVSDYSQSYAASGVGTDHIWFFDRAHPASLANGVAELLESGQGETQAGAGRDLACSSQLWRHRAERLLEMLGAA